jgi:hypothetical protein
MLILFDTSFNLCFYSEGKEINPYIVHGVACKDMHALFLFNFYLTFQNASKINFKERKYMHPRSKTPTLLDDIA